MKICLKLISTNHSFNKQSNPINAETLLKILMPYNYKTPFFFATTRNRSNSFAKLDHVLHTDNSVQTNLLKGSTD